MKLYINRLLLQDLVCLLLHLSLILGIIIHQIQTLLHDHLGCHLDHPFKFQSPPGAPRKTSSYSCST
ncbi:hypothetical protein L1987_17071 [Smallanthus sonchifolius]|uniref:Uncharacterized protein n=1 Tax=Smallanthus sonchifolius TaxID=185202 RepID=A0ACB9IVT6_9ASTR|nr:hypothetical protein L1987_17071 [Smallanthus sonchifolius]